MGNSSVMGALESGRSKEKQIPHFVRKRRSCSLSEPLSREEPWQVDIIGCMDYFYRSRGLSADLDFDDVSRRDHLAMSPVLRRSGKLGMLLRDEFLTPFRYYK